MRKIEEIRKDMQIQMEADIECGCELDVIDWRYEIGVLLSVNDAQVIIDALDKL